MLDINSKVLLGIFLILILSLFILIKIADYIKRINFTNINVTEKTIIKESPNIKKDKDEDKNLNDEAMDLESKWSKPQNVESNMRGLGEEKVIDGSKSLDAVQLMRGIRKNNK
jgi:hypothetical protein